MTCLQLSPALPSALAHPLWHATNGDVLTIFPLYDIYNGTNNDFLRPVGRRLSNWRERKLEWTANFDTRAGSLF
jgi:hypothetical protein